MQRIEGAVILGSTAHPPRRISKAQPKKRWALSLPLYPSQMSTHEVSRRSCAITCSRNVCTVIHGAILCHTLCNRARWCIQVSCRYWDRQPILVVSSCYLQCHHLSHSTKSNNVGRSSRGQSLGSTPQSQSRLPEEQPHKNHSLAPLPPLLAVTMIDSPWTEVAT